MVRKYSRQQGCPADEARGCYTVNNLFTSGAKTAVSGRFKKNKLTKFHFHLYDEARD